MSLVQSLKHSMILFTGLSRDALHVYFGLTAWLLAVLILRKSAGALLPWLIVLALACGGEVLDAIDDVSTFGHWRMGAALHDIVNTVFWPGCLALLARFTKVLK